MHWKVAISASAKEAVDAAHHLDNILSFLFAEVPTAAYSSSCRLDLGRSFLLESESTGYEMSSEDVGIVEFTMPLRGTITREIGKHAFTTSPGEFHLLLPSVRRTHVRASTRKAFRALTYFAPIDLLLPHLGAFDSNSIADRSRNLATQDELVTSFVLASFIQGIGQLVASKPKITHPGKARALCETWLSEMLATLLARQDDAIGEKSARWRIVQRVEERMRADYSQPITIADLANDAGVSVRALQLAFIAQRGKSPKSVLSDIRLTQARAMLIGAGKDETVTNVAWACGISHLARFAGAYRERFGEKPSETLLKSRTFRFGSGTAIRLEGRSESSRMTRSRHHISK